FRNVLRCQTLPDLDRNASRAYPPALVAKLEILRVRITGFAVLPIGQDRSAREVPAYGDRLTTLLNSSVAFLMCSLSAMISARSRRALTNNSASRVLASVNKGLCTNSVISL